MIYDLNPNPLNEFKMKVPIDKATLLAFKDWLMKNNLIIVHPSHLIGYNPIDHYFNHFINFCND